ncbi:2-C-methyl-D-erythritol 4-phosphate cytidylyltransferase [Agitococcus lubricus]|uniref:2-C-methyl-D-erythritol 4-phosphate cytidylyltransferase n=2 Tax=Agitococcus lubricus TaxID=1077255 RepID=A0A2T5IWQ0_9GAMM|nr:2-C-methyl-D-erythritol 4-phosphate cytidylyltransferase [Agitococcus lubricus]
MPAAGTGKRFGADKPKQYLALGQKTVMQCTVDRLTQLSQIQQVIIPIHPQDNFVHQLAFQQPEKIRFVMGGAERSDSVLAGLRAIQTQAHAQDWVLVHDVARPCVRLSDIQRLFEQLAHDEVGGILANQVRDTIKQGTAEQKISHTVPRQQLWQALTPQMFRFELLFKALMQAQQQGLQVTDEASAIELLGYQPRLIAGAYDNLKITYFEDLALAEYLLDRQKI